MSLIFSKTSSRAPPQRTLAPPDQRTKSRSLPRGLPSDGVYDGFEEEHEARQEALQEEARREALLQEETRLKFEFEELLNLKSELERRKKTERREINELQVRTIQKHNPVLGRKHYNCTFSILLHPKICWAKSSRTNEIIFRRKSQQCKPCTSIGPTVLTAVRRAVVSATFVVCNSK